MLKKKNATHVYHQQLKPNTMYCKNALNVFNINNYDSNFKLISDI